ncbi:unnamed protein product, partial [Amoebophrya sp. A120]
GVQPVGTTDAWNNKCKDLRFDHGPKGYLNEMAQLEEHKDKVDYYYATAAKLWDASPAASPAGDKRFLGYKKGEEQTKQDVKGGISAGYAWRAAWWMRRAWWQVTLTDEALQGGYQNGVDVESVRLWNRDDYTYWWHRR